MEGFQFPTISVAPRPSVSGRPPPPASMAVAQFLNPEEGKREFSPGSLLLSSYTDQSVSGRPPPPTSMAVSQFFNPEEGKREFSPGSLLLSSYTDQELLLDYHPLAFNLSFSVSLGLLPITLSLKTRGCGIKNSGRPVEEAGDVEHSRICKLRCFPPAAVIWDPISGLQIIPNLHSETILVDSSPAFWASTPGTEKTTILLMVDPHCSYKISAFISITAADGRFLLIYSPQIIGFFIAVIFFALMRQSRAWELDLPLPSMLAAVESNIIMPQSFLLVAVLPILISLVISLIISQPLPPFFSYFTVSLIGYAFANGGVIILILISQLVFSVVAMVHTFLKLRWRGCEENLRFVVFRRLVTIICNLFSFKAVRILRGNPTLVTAVTGSILVYFVHPAFGLFLLLLSHALYCHTALCSFLGASFRSHAQKEQVDSETKHNDRSQHSKIKSDGGMDPLLPVEETPLNSPNSARSYGDTQLEIFNFRHGMLILHLLAALMFVPSLVAWLQRIGLGQNLPWFWDSGLCICVIFHGLSSTPGFDSLSFPLPGFRGREVGLSFVYLLAGYYCFLSALALTPYKSFYSMAIVGIISTALRVIERKSREKGEVHLTFSRKHSHRH